MYFRISPWVYDLLVVHALRGGVLSIGALGLVVFPYWSYPFGFVLMLSLHSCACGVLCLCVVGVYVYIFNEGVVTKYFGIG